LEEFVKPFEVDLETFQENVETLEEFVQRFEEFVEKKYTLCPKIGQIRLKWGKFALFLKNGSFSRVTCSPLMRFYQCLDWVFVPVLVAARLALASPIPSIRLRHCVF
jgi:hypothetical protein